MELKVVLSISMAENSWISGIVFVKFLEHGKSQGGRIKEERSGVLEENYDKAIEILSSKKLDKIIQDFSDRAQRRQIKCMVQHYRDLSESQLVTIRDLFKFMLTIKSRCALQKKLVAGTTAPSASVQKNSISLSLHKDNSKEKYSRCKKFTNVIAHMDSRWPAKRLEFAAEVIVDALKEHKSEVGHGGMTRQDLRDAARMHIGDTGLLDYGLKSMNNVIVGCHIVRRGINSTRVLEYTIDDIDNPVKESEEKGEMHQKPLLDVSPAPIPGTDVYNDVVYLYNNTLMNYPESDLLELATQAVVDGKQFNMPTEISPSGELVTVPLHATVLDLKEAAEKALRDTYCIMDKFVVTEIDNLDEMEDKDVMFGALESVRCQCGARDDDGERMIACDIHELWQHTRCCGIEDSEAVPPLFVCPECCTSFGPPMTDSPLAYPSCQVQARTQGPVPSNPETHSTTRPTANISPGDQTRLTKHQAQIDGNPTDSSDPDMDQPDPKP
ncbi:Detected protein of unknown function [Hibiscus syriacus]|uniref:Uncharacterized protein n=1 Tax=Hibiscus syriacus TaxID=106335 RepID=A0A6A3A030_HIBSY|nr:Detected protein of unknown function [Hibiscus syriacus]